VLDAVPVFEFAAQRAWLPDAELAVAEQALILAVFELVVVELAVPEPASSARP
jgi:hypothetical protein